MSLHLSQHKCVCTCENDSESESESDSVHFCHALPVPQWHWQDQAGTARPGRPYFHRDDFGLKQAFHRESRWQPEGWQGGLGGHPPGSARDTARHSVTRRHSARGWSLVVSGWHWWQSLPVAVALPVAVGGVPGESGDSDSAECRRRFHWHWPLAHCCRYHWGGLGPWAAWATGPVASATTTARGSAAAESESLPVAR